MAGEKKRTNPLLVLLVLFLCLFLGAVLRRSASDMPSLSENTRRDPLKAESGDSKKPGDPVEQKTEDSSGKETPKATPTSTAAPGEEGRFVSPEAYRGEWVPVEDRWCFEVDGKPVTGWFYDVDGHVYYFNTKGIMQIGWLNQGGKRFYFDEDGILQKGKRKIEDRVYLFGQDGSLEGYAEPTPTPAPTSTPIPTPTSTPIPTPTPMFPEKVKSLSNGNMPAVALTFDDGPGDYTNDILDCLEKYGAKATFFMVGERVEYYPNVVARMAELGCELGNHTYHHKDLCTITEEEIQKELQMTNDAIANYTGQGTTVVRPPNGSYDDTVAAVVGYPMILWSVDTLDWSTKNPEATVAAVAENIEDGAIILMHDIYEQTAEAAEVLIKELSKAGYQLVTVHELAAMHGEELQTGIGYGAFAY